MFFLRPPSPSDVARVIDRARELSYAPVGRSRHDLPVPGFFNDRFACAVGAGPEDFARARDTLLSWSFLPSWTEMHPRGQPILPGAVVAVEIRHLGFFSVNPARILYLEDSPDCVRFGYGTLSGHAERGEELFGIRLDPVTGIVSFELRAYSLPRHPLAWAGLPVVRWLQGRFREECGRRFARVVGG